MEGLPKASRKITVYAKCWCFKTNKMLGDLIFCQEKTHDDLSKLCKCLSLLIMLYRPFRGAQTTHPITVNGMVTVYVNKHGSFKRIPVLIIGELTLNSLRGVSTGHANKSPA